MTYRQQVREVIWSGGGELEKFRYGVPELMLVASAHFLMSLRTLAAQNYCSFSSFLFFDHTGWKNFGDSQPIRFGSEKTAMASADMEGRAPDAWSIPPLSSMHG